LKLLHSNIIGDSGCDLLILHGFLGMSDNWKTHAKNWSSLGFRVHLIDQRNHGRSFWSTAFSYDLMADDIAHYCETYQLQEVLILGHSMGGKTAMQLACKHPHLFKAIVIADIAPKKYPPHHQKILQGLSDLDFNQIKSRTEADIFLSSYVTEPGVRMFLLKNLYWVEPGKLGLRINIEVLKDASDAIGKNLSDDAQSLLPCLFVKGELSDYILESDTLLIKHYFTNAEQVTIAEAGHWLHAEKPKLFFDTVTDWLTLQI
jgi:pimeloyl-ACP methyl ester carboxylesterase